MKNGILMTYLDEPSSKLWIDEFIPCIFTLLLSPVSIGQLNHLADVRKKALARLFKQKKPGYIYSITNFCLCTNLTEKIVDHYFDQVIHQELNNNKIYKLLVIPECEISASVVKNSLLKFTNQRFEVFSSFEDALEEINKKSEVLLEAESPADNFILKIFKI